jgi:hypothetical protein
MGIVVVVARRLSHWEVSATCAICSMVVSSLLLTTVLVYGSSGLRGLRGIIMLVSHMSRPSTMDKRQQ